MSYESKTEESQERAALYALGALCQHEARAFEEQLREGDAQLRADLESFEQVVDAIGYGAPAAEPPAYLFDILLTRLEKEEQLPTSANVLAFQAFQERSAPLAASTDTAETAGVAETSVSSPNMAPNMAPNVTSNVVPLAARRPSKAATVIPWALAASLLIGSVVALLAWQQAKQQNETLQTEIAAVRRQTDELRAQMSAQNNRVLELARINQVLATPEHRVIEMAGFDGAPDSSGKIYWDTKAAQWAVVAQLPPAPAGKVYQLWFVTADEKVSAGLIKPDASGHAFTVVNVPTELANLAAAAITLEPEGGSAQPTMPIFTIGKIA